VLFIIIHGTAFGIGIWTKRSHLAQDGLREGLGVLGVMTITHIPVLVLLTIVSIRLMVLISTVSVFSRGMK